VWLRDFDLGSSLDDVPPPDAVITTSGWGDRTTVWGRTARYTGTGENVASAVLITAPTSGDLVLTIDYLDGIGPYVSSVAVDQWDAGSWRDYVIGNIFFTTSTGWRSQVLRVPASVIATAGDANTRLGGKQIAIRFWGPGAGGYGNGWPTSSFAVDKVAVASSAELSPPDEPMPILTATPDGSDPRILQITLPTNTLQAGQRYSLEVLNLRDAAGNFTPWRHSHEFSYYESSGVQTPWSLY
jgi:hypothetical protein